MAWVFNHGQTITLINKIEIGTDELNQPIYEEKQIEDKGVI